MLRNNLISHHHPVDGFRWRSHEVTRIEGFSDAVFGFATTLLIVSLEVPKTSTELLEAMRGFGGFVITFVILASMWYSQHTFFRRYGLEDRITVVLNLALLFTVLFFVYPLKFLFSALILDPTLHTITVETPHGPQLPILPQHRPWIYMIFGAGFVAVFLVFFLLYRHAYLKRDELGLNEYETFETQHSLRRLRISIFVGLMYFAVAGMQALPQKTERQERVVAVVAVVILAGFAAAMVTMARLARQRRRRRREWIAQQSAPGEDHSS